MFMTNLCSKCVSPIASRHNLDDLSSLPYLDITSSSIRSAPSLTRADGDSFIPPYCLDFNYYSSHTFHDNPDIKEAFLSKSAFSIIHCNIRSLRANFDSLTNMLSELNYYPCTIIGLSETILINNKDSLINTDIPGYTFISQPTNSSAGGVGLYVKQDLNYTIRTKLSLSNSDFESLWIEIDNQSHKNFISGIIYRHPNSDISSFMDYLNSTL